MRTSAKHTLLEGTTAQLLPQRLHAHTNGGAWHLLSQLFPYGRKPQPFVSNRRPAERFAVAQRQGQHNFKLFYFSNSLFQNQTKEMSHTKTTPPSMPVWSVLFLSLLSVSRRQRILPAEWRFVSRR